MHLRERERESGVCSHEYVCAHARVCVYLCMHIHVCMVFVCAKCKYILLIAYLFKIMHIQKFNITELSWLKYIILNLLLLNCLSFMLLADQAAFLCHKPFFKVFKHWMVIHLTLVRLKLSVSSFSFSSFTFIFCMHNEYVFKVITWQQNICFGFSVFRPVDNSTTALHGLL